jgi:hypothetical protein
MEFDYNYSTLAFNTGTDVFNTESGTGATQGGIWMAGGAPAVGSGSIFFSVGNGGLGAGNYGESVVKLDGEMAFTGSYTPNDALALNNGSALGNGNVSCGPTNPSYCGSNDQITLTSADWDLGSGGVVLLNPNPSLGSGNSELVAAGKQGMLYVLKQSLAQAVTDASDQKTYACDPTNTAVIPQCFQAIALSSNLNGKPDWGNRATPAFWGASSYNLLYMAGLSDVLNAYQLSTSGTSAGTFNTVPTWSSVQTWGSLGASPVVTWDSNSTGDAIVWALDNHKFGTTNGNSAGPAQLFAYKAASSGSSVAPLAYSSSTSTTMPGAVKFTVPTIVDGKIIIGGGAPSYVINQGNCQAPWTGTNFQCGQLTILQ